MSTREKHSPIAGAAPSGRSYARPYGRLRSYGRGMASYGCRSARAAPRRDRRCGSRPRARSRRRDTLSPLAATCERVLCRSAWLANCVATKRSIQKRPKLNPHLPDQLANLPQSYCSNRSMNHFSTLVQTSSLPTWSSMPCSRLGLSFTSITMKPASVCLMSTP
jgi:hypothetical protein